MDDHHDMLFCIARLARAMRCCRQESVFCEDLTFWQFFILETVGRDVRLPLSRLHDILAVEKSTTTRLVTPLVKRRLLTRERDPGDGRAVHLQLTPEGQAVRRRIRDCVAGYFEAIEAQIPANTRQQVLESVAIFAEALEKAGPACCSTIGETIHDPDKTRQH
jgi:DNA-binding MarR family transcriptional regulator